MKSLVSYQFASTHTQSTSFGTERRTANQEHFNVLRPSRRKRDEQMESAGPRAHVAVCTPNAVMRARKLKSRRSIQIRPSVFFFSVCAARLRAYTIQPSAPFFAHILHRSFLLLVSLVRGQCECECLRARLYIVAITLFSFVPFASV